MVTKKKICVFTGTRAEYGLLMPVMEEIRQDSELLLQIIVTGMHLSPEFGATYNTIQEDGFHIDEKVEMLVSSDTPTGITKSMALGLIGYGEALHRLQPDIVIILGDRFEGLVMAQACMVARIPIGHLHGGEATYGVIDEAIRHSITKMSHLHFTSCEEYRKRVIQLGEHPERVFNVGAIGAENIKKSVLLDREDLATALNFNLGERFLLVTFHPVSLEYASAKNQFESLLAVLDQMVKNSNTKVIFTKANADTEGRIINQLIDNYTSCNPAKAAGFDSLGKEKYLSAMKHAVAVVGNSSSGILEAPSLKIPVVNIGDRQKGRIRAMNVIDCEPNRLSISQALNKAMSKEFASSLVEMTSPYEKDDTSKIIKEILKQTNFDNMLKKAFYDINYS